MSNCGFVDPLYLTKRFSRSYRKNISIGQTDVIKNYNTNMCGVDLADELVSTYRSKIRGKKWWWPIFKHFFDLTISNV